MPGSCAMTAEGIEAAQCKADEIERDQKRTQTISDAAYIMLFRKWAQENNINIQHKKNEQTAFQVWCIMTKKMELITRALYDCRVELEEISKELRKN